ncbi:CIA30 family protein [Rhodohalobacter sp.]|uniref:CIA30 family protein n=1 Tax=Rhodohalobacter sp. TaxID=1974210 RepID=UPI002ACD3890|nr:CIA30 family protein [Rhodohalobacter sp.]MDZ7756330.1 CIA30 family protein [Rhodohalobacter sp.]
MKFIIGILFFILSMNTQLIFDFDKNSDLKDWSIVDDVVMGGRSNGTMGLSPEGHGLFLGDIA